jgi:hypothetical protein
MGDRDEYTRQCCDHLTDALAIRHGVCKYQPPELTANLKKLPWEDALTLITK